MKDYKYVGFWQRVISNIIDWMILSGISAAMFTRFNLVETVLADYLLIFSYLPLILYAVISWKLFGATPGKLILRIKIVDAQTGNIPSIWKLVIRFFIYLISVVSLFLGNFWIGLDSRKQSWHDKVAGTIVVRRNRIKKTKEIEPNTELEKMDPLFPSAPSLKDNSRWNWGKYLLLITAICFISITYFLFFADEPLLSGAREWLYEPEFVENNPENNGYYHLIGLFVPEGQSNVDSGFNWVKDNNNFVYDLSKNFDLDYDIGYPDTIKISSTLSGNILDAFNSESFVRFCEKNKEIIVSNYNRSNYVEKRLKDISETKYFKNTIIAHFSSRDPIFMSLVRYNLLKNSYITTLYLNGSKSKALSLLEDDIKFFRELSEKADFMILKLMTVLLLERILKTFNHLLDYEKVELSYLQNSIQDILPISVSERDMEKVVKREFAIDVSTFLFTFNLTPKPKDFLCKNSYFTQDVVRSSRSALFKPHKSLNQQYLIRNYLADLSRVTGKEFNQLDKNPYTFQPSILDFANNYLASMIFLEIADASYNKYIAFFHNTDAYINMLKLKTMIIDQNIAKSNIPVFLEVHKNSLYNPYTEEAFEWDTERSMLYYEGPYDEDNNMKELKIN